MIVSEIKAALGLVSTLMRIQGGENADFDTDQKNGDPQKMAFAAYADSNWSMVATNCLTASTLF